MPSSGIGTPYWYEWEVGLLEALKMMFDISISSVVLQSEQFESLDDVVVNYVDNSMMNLQVKHTDVGENFTYSTLTSGDRPMLKKWAHEWNEKKANANIKEIKLITNKPWGSRASKNKCSFADFVQYVYPELKKNYNHSFSTPSHREAASWFKSQIDFLGKDAESFIKVLSFNHEKNIEGVEEQIKEFVEQILGINDQKIVELHKNNLLAQLRVWATSLRKKQEITREDVVKALCISSRRLPEYQLYPERPIFPSRKSFANIFFESIKKSDKKMFFLDGMPGSGKTNFISYISQLDDSIVDFRFYTYLPVNKNSSIFSDDEGYYTGQFLWESILFQMKKYFESRDLLYEMKFPLIYQHMSVTEMRETALKYLSKYSELIERPCYVFIDGLDHAARSKDVRNSFLYQLPRPDELPDNVKIVLVSQPINDSFPSWMNKNQNIEYFSLPCMEEQDIVLLLNTEKITIENVDVNSLAKSIMSVVGNNALNVLFALYELKERCVDLSFEGVIAFLKERRLNGHIAGYYEWIASSVEDNVLSIKIKMIFAFASQKIPLENLALLCDAKVEDLALMISKYYPIIVNDSAGYYTLHNDVRLYFRNSITGNSNYDVFLSSIHNQVKQNSILEKYQYDILFGLLSETNNKQDLIDLLTPEYFIKSIDYDVSVDKLMHQFKTILDMIIASGSLDSIDKLSLMSATISQYINNIEYNEKQVGLFEDNVRNVKTDSEKYILDPYKDINTIVDDVFSLVKNEQCLRGERLFLELFSQMTLTDFLEGNQDHSDLLYFEKCGYICRYFAKDILLQECDIDTNSYDRFVKGWLNASVYFVGEQELSDTFSFKQCPRMIFNNYMKDICQSDKITSGTFEELKRRLLSAKNISVFALLDLCFLGKLKSYNCIDLEKSLIDRYEEILTDSGIEYDKTRILYFSMMIFCLFEYYDSESMPKLLDQILCKAYVKQTDIGYSVAFKQFKLLRKVSNDFYIKNENVNEQILDIFNVSCFINQNGSGACSNCEAYEVRRVLLKIIYATLSNENDLNKIQEVCESIKLFYTWENSIFVKELIPLFYLCNARDDFKEIVDYWCGERGILWDMSYTDVEYIGDSIIDALNRFGDFSEAESIRLRIRHKLFGYVGHKDYSLNDLLDYYKIIPNSEAKMNDFGLDFLRISDIARSVGDNRMSGDITDAIFDTAFCLGIPYMSALYELKNNPQEFYYWRKCFLDTYYRHLSSTKFSDDDLLHLYYIVNAWVKPEIEESIKRVYTKIDYLNKYNAAIIDLVKDDSVKSFLLSKGNCTSADNKYNTPLSNYEFLGTELLIVNQIKKDGFTDNIKNDINAYISSEDKNHVSFLVELSKVIPKGYQDEFVKQCVINYIIGNHKYSFYEYNLDYLIGTYSVQFDTPDWLSLLMSASNKILSDGIERFYGINRDIECICFQYYRNCGLQKIEDVFEAKLNMHWSWITSCDSIKFDRYEIIVDEKIKSIKDFAVFQNISKHS